jgi:hypothetical protein
MSTRDIACLNCGFTGILDVHSEGMTFRKIAYSSTWGITLTPAISTISAPLAGSCSLSIPWRSWEKSPSKGFLEG